MANAPVGEMSAWSGVLKDFFRQIDDGSHTLESVKAFNEHRIVSLLVALVEATQKKLQKFFRVDVDPLPPEFTEENLAKWAGFDFRPVYLPMEGIGENCKLKNWVKPEKWFYQKIGEGKLAPDSAKLYRGWYLADFTVGVNYTDGTQVFSNDPLALIISKLREEGKIGKHDNTPSGSRFAITNDEWRDVVCPAIAEAFGFKPEQVRLERAVESNAIGNLYDSNRGRFNMWEWFDDKFEDSSRLYGGHREYGGLAYVNYDWSSNRSGSIAGRPLVSFAK
ncbi:MAG: hypothetical protein Q8Q95_02295 [bacterium]|nr:hypothetical protein [bacterium]